MALTLAELEILRKKTRFKMCSSIWLLTGSPQRPKTKLTEQRSGMFLITSHVLQVLQFSLDGSSQTAGYRQ